MKQKLLLLGAVFFGFLAFMLSYNQLQMEKRRIMGTGETVELIKVVRDIAAGEELSESDIARIEEQRVITPGIISREIPWSQRTTVIGRRLESTMNAGQVLLRTDLKPMTQRQSLSGIIQSGMRALSIPVDTVGAVSSLLQPNDNVDVIGTFRFPDMRGDQSLDTVTLTLLQNVKILSVGGRWGNAGIDPTSSRSYSTVTLQVRPDEVEMLVFATQKGKLSLSLRNYEDSKIDTSLENRSVNFKQLEKDIPEYNKRRRSLR